MSTARALHPQELLLLSRRRAAAAPPSARPTVTVVMLSLDRLHLTRRCVESIYAHADYPFVLFIHDDGSQPETLDYLRSLRAAYDNVEVFESLEETGHHYLGFFGHDPRLRLRTAGRPRSRRAPRSGRAGGSR